MSKDNYESLIKKQIMIEYINTYLSKQSPDEIVDNLNRIFKLKEKVIYNLASYVRKEVEEKNRPLTKTLGNIAFFAHVLYLYMDKNNGQPIHKCAR